jgi:predicted kinase
MIIIFPVGASGAGKSFIGDKIQAQVPSLKIVCMDDIRRDLTGSVGDQSQNKKVFEMSQKAIVDALSAKESVYESATNVRGKSALLQRIQNFREQFKGLKIAIAFLDDSLDPALCKERVGIDINSGKDRSNTPGDIIDDQCKRFLKMRNEDWSMARTQGIEVFYISESRPRDLTRLINYTKSNIS